METYNYIKSLHLIFVITWFAGLFYIVRLFVYQIEANEKPSPEREILQNQYKIMTYRLWFLVGFNLIYEQSNNIKKPSKPSDYEY